MTRSEPVEAAAAQEREEVTVRTARFVPPGTSVLFASVPIDSPRSIGRDVSRRQAQRRLVTVLLKHLRASEAPPGRPPLHSDGSALPVQIVHDPLGRPRLLSRERRSPSISFSEGGGSVWAALGGEGAEVGIDVAGSDEFPRSYPFHRVFHGEELAHAVRTAGGDLGRAAALLWSTKEAVVKALGCAFHGADPRNVTIDPEVRDNEGHTFPVGLSGKALRRLPLGASAVWVRSFPEEMAWVSVAVLSCKRE